MRSSVLAAEEALQQGALRGGGASPPYAHLLDGGPPPALPPAAEAALGRALALWCEAQARPYPRAALAGAASSAVQAYGLLGAHRLALALYRALGVGGGGEAAEPGGGGGGAPPAWAPASLESLMRSARTVGDGDAYLLLLEAQERLPAESRPPPALGVPPASLPPAVAAAEGARLEGLLEAVARAPAGSGGASRAGPVLAALASLEWPVSHMLLRLLARGALARGELAHAAEAARELALLRRCVEAGEEEASGAEAAGAPAAHAPPSSPAAFLRNPANNSAALGAAAAADAALAAEVFSTALERAAPRAAALAYHALKELAARAESARGEGAGGGGPRAAAILGDPVATAGMMAVRARPAEQRAA